MNQLVREDVKNNNIYSYCSISNCYTKYYYYDTHGNITDIKKFNYGESEYQYVIPDFYEYSSSNPQVKMRYNGGYDYRKIYNLQIGETPNLYFNFYIYDSYQVYMPSYLIESNLNVNKVGYYYNTYYATDGYLNVTFRIVFKVGNPESTPNNYPIEHLQYIYNTQWKDRLDSIQSITYDSNGNITSITPINTFTYDQIGNPTKIYNFKYNGVIYAYADLDYEGRVLRKIDIKQNDGKTIYTISYKYNDQGLRTEKTIFTHSTQTTVTCKYFLDGDKVLRETINSGSTTKYVDYLYDVDGTLIGFKYNNNIYLYIRNLQGDITKIVNESGNVVVEYVYDAWGNIVYQTSSELAKINPYRYRGYRYDEETGWYYLNSRYYNPEIGRFINADDVSYLEPGSLNGLNLYTYCENNPVMMVDPDGNFGILALFAITVSSAIIGGGIQLASNALAGKTGSELWEGVAGAALGAGVNSLVLCLTISTGGASIFIAAGASALLQTSIDAIESNIRGKDVNFGSFTSDLAINFGTAAVGNYIGGKLIPTNRGWFQPKKFLSVFTKSYGQKILLQSTIGSGISGAVNYFRKNERDIIPIIPVPVVPLYPRH